MGIISRGNNSSSNGDLRRLRTTDERAWRSRVVRDSSLPALSFTLGSSSDSQTFFVSTTQDRVTGTRR